MNSDGQLYTIEGVAASVLVLTTVYLVLSTTTVLTPGETHIYDMQLEQLGNDVLAVMDLKETWGTGVHRYPKSPLEHYVESIGSGGEDQFKNHFLLLANQTTAGNDNLKFTSKIAYRKITGEIETRDFAQTNDYNRERAVKVTRWVNIDDSGGIFGDHRYKTVLLEVLLWRG